MPTSDPDTRRRRLMFRAWHRGTREADLLLGRFADAHVPGFEPTLLDGFEALLTESDPDIYDWVTGRLEPPPGHDNMVTLLRNFSNKTVRA
ncbi:MAG: succinate dehydrogenase assembly factor 2 [Alphaproteobacteria bacterium]|nr:succinate dehydrogenase assembly factor 2 [Alphaproteobacteria bacterium]